MDTTVLDVAKYNREALSREASSLLSVVKNCSNLYVARDRLRARVSQLRFDALAQGNRVHSAELMRVRDCGQAMNAILTERADAQAGFSVAQALWDVAAGRARDDLSPGFFAEMIHVVRGLMGRAKVRYLAERQVEAELSGRDAALARSRELDRLWGLAERQMRRFANGLSPEARVRRERRRRQVLEALGGDDADWNDWHWHMRRLVVDSDSLTRLVPLAEEQRRTIDAARAGRLPFAITPYYASLMDEDGDSRDRALRAQVIPSAGYVDRMLQAKGGRGTLCDFMLESDTSPIDLVTRRYPAIVILKPFNTCPQICVYCQRNWEIEEAMAPGALAPAARIDAAIDWIAKHSAIREVLITGGDPLAMSDSRIEKILGSLAAIPHVDLIRIGSRTPVTLPMRITDKLAGLLGSFRELGRREIALVTHVEHPYELTVEMAEAVNRLRRAGLSVYNQQVYTFYVSRRFESALLRLLLRRIGIEPYYTFAPKGKDETADFQVPLARLLQEQKEEARLMPGTRRTDEAVYNVPGLGKNYLRALQHRDLLSVLPDGSRVYEFHPWEKNVVEQDTYVGTQMPILDYLARLAEAGENPADYSSIWYYF